VTRLSSVTHGELEFLRTQELLRRHLPAAPAAVLDVGGGPGVHARWLVSDGYAVHLVDLVERHLQQALVSSGCTAELGDARALEAENGSYDAVLLLGPLYHLTEVGEPGVDHLQPELFGRPCSGLPRGTDNPATQRSGHPAQQDLGMGEWARPDSLNSINTH
jgi:SAM-dependent methyltransferase